MMGIKQSRCSIIRIWHDTMESLRSIEPTTKKQRSMKMVALETWQELGEICGLKEGVDVTTVRLALPLSNLPYWRTPKRCFWGACACSTYKPAHRLRVCKGCWRALYCSTRCQSLCVPVLSILDEYTFTFVYHKVIGRLVTAVFAIRNMQIANHLRSVKNTSFRSRAQINGLESS